MFYLSEQKYKKKLKKIEEQNKSYERKQALKDMRNQRVDKKLSTSKIALFSIIILCIEIVIFAEVVMVVFQNLTAIYALIGIPAALAPIVWGYYAKSKSENSIGGIVYETTMAKLNNQQGECDTSITDGGVG